MEPSTRNAIATGMVSFACEDIHGIHGKRLGGQSCNGLDWQESDVFASSFHNYSIHTTRTISSQFHVNSSCFMKKRQSELSFRLFLYSMSLSFGMRTQFQHTNDTCEYLQSLCNDSGQDIKYSFLNRIYFRYQRED